MTDRITLQDIEQRCAMLKEKIPNLPLCCHTGCKSPVDVTMDGEDTSCPYHRLLHDYFLYVVDEGRSHPNQSDNTREQYRKIVEDWEASAGKDACDKIVIQMAEDPLNWVC